MVQGLMSLYFFLFLLLYREYLALAPIFLDCLKNLCTILLLILTESEVQSLSDLSEVFVVDTKFSDFSAPCPGHKTTIFQSQTVVFLMSTFFFQLFQIILHMGNCCYCKGKLF